MILNEITKILIVRLSSMGDILLTTPLLRTLKTNYPHLQIDFLLRKEFKDILLYNNYIDKLYLLERNRSSSLQIKAQIANANYNLIVDLQNNLRSASLILSARCKKLKFNKRTLEKFLLVNFKLNKLNNALSIPERYASTIPDFFLDEEGLDLFLPPNIKSQLIQKENLIGFCPGSKHFTKMWPKEYYIQLGNKLINNGYNVVILGGIAETLICKEIHSKISNSNCIITENDIFQISKEMLQCKAIVCNDSGLMHVSCANKIPLVALFGSTVKEFGFFPYKNKSIVIENNSLSCRPCSHIGKSKCPQKHFKCMKEITPEIVYKNLISLLNYD